MERICETCGHANLAKHEICRACGHIMEAEPRPAPARVETPSPAPRAKPTPPPPPSAPTPPPPAPAPSPSTATTAVATKPKPSKRRRRPKLGKWREVIRRHERQDAAAHSPRPSRWVRRRRRASTTGSPDPYDLTRYIWRVSIILIALIGVATRGCN